jgi:hypothetical protein
MNREKGDDAMMTPARSTRDAVAFGPFSLVASERLLTRELARALPLRTFNDVGGCRMLTFVLIAIALRLVAVHER